MCVFFVRVGLWMCEFFRFVFKSSALYQHDNVRAALSAADSGDRAP